MSIFSLYSLINNKKDRGFSNIFSHIFKISQKSKAFGYNFMKFWAFKNLLWSHARSHTKFGHDHRFSCFDVYWIQTNTQTNKCKVYKIVSKKKKVKKVGKILFVMPETIFRIKNVFSRRKSFILFIYTFLNTEEIFKFQKKGIEFLPQTWIF